MEKHGKERRNFMIVYFYFVSTFTDVSEGRVVLGTA